MNNDQLKILLSNPIIDYWANIFTDMWVASIIESYYGPTKFLMNASNLDFSVWPNAKVVDTLYKDIAPTTLCNHRAILPNLKI